MNHSHGIRTSPGAVRAFAEELAALPSAWPRHGEAAVARAVARMLARAQFRCVRAAMPSLPRGRANVLAYRLGSRRDAILLTGHLDTVLPDPRQTWGRSRRLGRAIVRGRGILDMKSGIAAGCAAAVELHRRGFDGSILFLGVADEEGDSSGMRSALLPLLRLRDRLRLRIAAAVNLDFVDAAEGWTAYTGSVGKLLVGVALACDTRHASESSSSSGVVGALARVTSALARDPRLRGGESVDLPRPVLLHAETVREAYGVSVPSVARLELHVPFFRRTPKEVIDAVCASVGDALGARARVERLRAPPEGGRPSASTADPRASAFSAALERLRARRLDAAVRACVYLAPPVYAPVETPSSAPVISALRRVALADRAGPPLRVRSCYPFISDLSHLRRARDGETAGARSAERDLVARTLPPAAGAEFVRARDLATKLDLPIVNVGPAGGGAHTRDEWVDADVAFRRLPRALVALAHETIAEIDRHQAGPRSRLGNPGKRSSTPKNRSSER
jgi:arginine utilization protein RocB